MESTATTRAIDNLAVVWHLSPDELAAITGLRDADAQPSREANERMSLLLGIFQALHTLHDDDLADSWIKHPNTNPLFAGGTPLNAMLTDGLPRMREVRALLDGRVQGQP